MSSRSLSPTHALPALLLAALLAPASLHAQTAVTGWTLSASDAANTTQGPTTFQQTTYAVTGFTAGANAFTYDASVATDVYIRRNAVSANNSSTWYYGSTVTDATGTYKSSLPQLLKDNNILQGADNLFANTATNADEAGNIERVDFRWNAGITANSTDGITLFDRGAIGAHDAFKIAVFTGWSSDQPTVYAGNIVTVNSINYGTNLDTNPTVAGDQLAPNYNLYRYDTGDDISVIDHNDGNNAGQGIGGTFISFQSLGIADGTLIRGYSIFSSDLNTTTVTNLVDWNNATYFPTNTPNSNGGLDLVAVNGRIARQAVPEPSTYGALFAGLSMAGYIGFRRRHTRRTAAQQA